MAVRGDHQHKITSVLAEDEASPNLISLEQHIDPISVKAECASPSKLAAGPVFIKAPTLQPQTILPTGTPGYTVCERAEFIYGPAASKKAC